MRLSEGVEWAAHCVVLLALLPPDAALPAARLAEYHGVPRPYLAKILQALARVDIVASVPGRGGGYRLTRSPAEVTLLDVVLAVDGDESPFRCTEIRRRGPSAGGLSTMMPPCAIAASMYRAESAWRAELAATTFADVTERMLRQVPAAAVELGSRWLETAVTHPAAAQS